MKFHAATPAYIIKNEGIILRPQGDSFESQAVLNPACIEKDGVTHMLYRAVREGNYSTIGYCRLQNNKVIYRSPQPVIVPEFDYERHGVEDPRITEIDGTYYIFYVSYDGASALVAYATTTDFITFTKHGIISPRMRYKDAMDLVRGKKISPRYFHYERRLIRRNGPDVMLWDKDFVLFPKKFDDSFLFLHRIFPSIQIASTKQFSDLTDAFWKEHLLTLERHTLMDPVYRFENHKIGAGCPPIETPEGWLIIYHSVGHRLFKIFKNYFACAALLDKHNPQKVIARLPHPLFQPTTKWERSGTVDGVVFPTGAVIRDERLYIYYGAADSMIGCKSLKLRDLLDELLRHPVI